MPEIDTRNRLYTVVSKVLNIPVAEVKDDLAVGEVPQWDSLAHVTLISAVEKEFNIKFEVDQVFEIEEVEDFLDILTTN